MSIENGLEIKKSKPSQKYNVKYRPYSPGLTLEVT